jgi:hypothetical protein
MSLSFIFNTLLEFCVFSFLFSVSILSPYYLNHLFIENN